MTIRRTLLILQVDWDDERLDPGLQLPQDHPSEWDFHDLLFLGDNEAVKVLQEREIPEGEWDDFDLVKI